jgi:hypothetical protein
MLLRFEANNACIWSFVFNQLYNESLYLFGLHTIYALYRLLQIMTLCPN